jgi:hypothetical protein
MAKYKGLQGVANNLASSFSSVMNREVLGELCNVSLKYSIGCIEIDLLSGQTNVPLESNALHKSIMHYKKWINQEIEKLNIAKENIQGISINLYISADERAEKYRCKVIIKADNKNYEGYYFSTFA